MSTKKEKKAKKISEQGLTHLVIRKNLRESLKEAAKKRGMKLSSYSERLLEKGLFEDAELISGERA